MRKHSAPYVTAPALSDDVVIATNGRTNNVATDEMSPGVQHDVQNILEVVS